MKQRASFEAEVLERGAEKRQVEDFRIRGYLTGATREVFDQVGILSQRIA